MRTTSAEEARTFLAAGALDSVLARADVAA
jgi:hypothetical protein